MSSMYPTSLHNLLGHQLKSSKPLVNATSVKLAPASWPQNTSHRWHNPHTLAPAHTVGMRGHEKVFFCQKLCQQSAGLFYQAETFLLFAGHDIDKNSLAHKISNQKPDAKNLLGTCRPLEEATESQCPRIPYLWRG